MDLSIYSAKPDKTIREHTDELLQNLKKLNNLGYIKSEKINRLTRIACEYHDYGKANREFQKRIKNNTKFDENNEIAHNILSLFFLDKDQFEDIKEYYKVSFAVLNHHNYCDNIKTIQNDSSKKIINTLLNEFEVFPITRRITNDIWKTAEDDETILIKGLLHKCDYSASSGNVIEYKNDFLNLGLSNLIRNWKSKDNDSDWNDLQKFCKINSNKNIIVIAQTGMGKTEAGLHWIGDNKGFFILPLKTAINAIYTRIKENILEKKDTEYRLALLHSDSLSYYNKNNENDTDIIEYYKQSKQFSLPLSISTVDQIFDFVFKYPGYELKLTTLSYSKIVIDEIQMYGADILAFLICGIKKINKLGGKIAILTATLSPVIRHLLKNGEDPILFEEATFVNDMNRHNLKIFDDMINSDAIYNKYTRNQGSNNNKILVVCNTVKKAQEIYNKLLDKKVKNINIIHGKFTKYERAIKEEKIKEFGKTEVRSEGIWIATQIVEASLDIDFDFLFTELSDLNGLFQRLGRCNRKGVKNVDEPNCFIFLEIDKSLLISGDKGFIDKKIYELSKEAIKNLDGLITENDKVRIINDTLTMKNLEGSDFLIKYNEFTNWVEDLYPYQVDKNEIKFRNIISYDVIPEPIYIKHVKEIDSKSTLLMDSKIDKLRKVELREDIIKYTVSVGIYDINISGLKTITKKIMLSKNEFIHVVKCHYSQLGFIRLSSGEAKIKIIKDNSNNFF